MCKLTCNIQHIKMTKVGKWWLKTKSFTRHKKAIALATARGDKWDVFAFFKQKRSNHSTIQSGGYAYEATYSISSSYMFNDLWTCHCRYSAVDKNRNYRSDIETKIGETHNLLDVKSCVNTQWCVYDIKQGSWQSKALQYRRYYVFERVENKKHC